MEIDLLLRVAIAFLKDMNLEEFKKLVYETQFLLADINSFESEKLPKDSVKEHNKSHQSLDIKEPEFHIVSPRYEAEILLGYILNMTRVELHTHAKKEVTDFDKQRYFKMLAMRKNGMPLEYLTNRVSFYDLELYINDKVLIPRHETELLVEHALEIIKAHNITHFVEVGVGSGAISAAILTHTEETCVVATDISKEALNVARYNMQQLGLESRCEFVESDLLLSPYLIMRKPITLLVSNPPYIANNYPLNQEVLCEPHVALFGGENGDEILKKLIVQAREKQIQFLICEMGYDQKESMQEALLNSGYKPTFYKDYAGFDRGFIAKLMF
ncbi:peptide chain release factor N(5)-glutamine methyltransferase [Helicobacter trogontum]|uniref:peptide chain release factor N(5)-glutamine methyltransferase n=1 Tax=Helicobacter trogontum TaxID=50960 RepID=A0A4U8S5S9_9HELI|nr:peptide chain release factor N(5)-glutamine methyltransferase [Helicobacter trogontum]TLD81179.1 peptide chain release factor N(5)-glutamine methyltransferase [Helicobacter trogontum]